MASRTNLRDRLVAARRRYGLDEIEAQGYLQLPNSLTSRGGL